MNKKTTRITVRFNEEEMNLLRENAKKSGMKLSTFLRVTSLSMKAPASISDRELMLQLLKIGGNLNQCTRKLNTIGTVDDELLNSIKTAIKAIHRVRKMFQK